jgi:hypothetical protein
LTWLVIGVSDTGLSVPATSHETAQPCDNIVSTSASA